MRIPALTALVILCIAGLLGAQQPPPPPSQRLTPKLRSGVELVSLHVSVTADGKYVTDLEQPEGEVCEDGAKQTVTFFSQKKQPIALAILLDTSNRMEDK